MPETDTSEPRTEQQENPAVYKTRIVRSGPGTQDAGVNHFTDVEEAKRWLEGYYEIRFDKTPGEWEADRHDDERWHMRPEEVSGSRAVVRRITIREDAAELLDRLEDTMAEINGGAEA